MRAISCLCGSGIKGTGAPAYLLLIVDPMEQAVRFGTMQIVFHTDILLEFEENVRAFRADPAGKPAGSGGMRVDVPISRAAKIPEPTGTFCAADSFLRYYRDGEFFYAFSHLDRAGVTSLMTRWRADFSEVSILVNAQTCTERVSVRELFLYFPLAAFLSAYGAVQLHASRIDTAGGAILFTGPSGAGKSTQARLWEEYAGARIVNHDRVLVQSCADGFLTSGCLRDGSELSWSNEVLPLAAIVLLRHGTENVLRAASPLDGLNRLMSQTCADPWDAAQLTRNRQLWMDVFEALPVYDYTCLAGREAVTVLQEQLRRDGILPQV